MKSIDQRIRQAFSNAAIQYDVLTGLHKEIARELMAKIKDVEAAERILDVGMGTAYLTKKLKSYFPISYVVGLDSAAGMVDKVKKEDEDFKIIQADAAYLPFQKESFDIVASNLSYQWVEDLYKAFTSCHQSLKDGGVFCATMFGYNTFNELFFSLERSREIKDKQFLIQRLPNHNKIQEAMQTAGFREIEMKSELISGHFPDMMILIKWIKDIGANALERNFYVGRDWMKSANDYYEKNFRDHLGVQVTFEVIWIQAKK